MRIFKNIFKKNPKPQWEEFVVFIKAKITHPELSPDSPIKDCEIPYRFRYDPVTKKFQKGRYFRRYGDKNSDWKKDDPNNYINVISDINVLDKIQEIQEKYNENNKAILRENSINDLLK